MVLSFNFRTKLSNVTDIDKDSKPYFQTIHLDKAKDIQAKNITRAVSTNYQTCIQNRKRTDDNRNRSKRIKVPEQQGVKIERK